MFDFKVSNLMWIIPELKKKGKHNQTLIIHNDPENSFFLTNLDVEI